jgi:hypothetical protein
VKVGLLNGALLERLVPSAVTDDSGARVVTWACKLVKTAWALVMASDKVEIREEIWEKLSAIASPLDPVGVGLNWEIEFESAVQVMHLCSAWQKETPME